MKEKLQETVVELIRDYKSRKWLTCIGAIAIVVANAVYEWGLTDMHLNYIIGIAILYVVVEGILDTAERSNRKAS